MRSRIAARFKRIKPWWFTAGVVLILFGAVLLSPGWLPYNMDEFVSYHPLGCAYHPYTYIYHVYRDSCHTKSLALPFGDIRLPLLSYPYIGSFPAVVFAPIWLLLQAPIAARIQGYLFFLAATALAAKLTRVPFRTSLLASLIFPVYFTAFMADTGPVGLQIILLLLILLALPQLLATSERPKKLLLAAAIGILLFLGLWTKMVFAWLAPALLVYAWYCIRETNKSVATLMKENYGALCLGLASLAIPWLLLLFSTDVTGNFYVRTMLLAGGFSLDTPTVVATAHKIMRYFADASYILPANLLIPQSYTDLLPAFLTIGLMTWGFLKLQHETPRLTAFTLMTLLTLGVIFTMKQSWGPHHYIVAGYLFILPTSIVIQAIWQKSPGTVFATIGVMLLFWASFLLRLPHATINPLMSREKDMLAHYIHASDLDERSVQVHTGWGTFFINHTFGDRNQLALYIDNISAHYSQLLTLANFENRTIVLITPNGAYERDNPHHAALFGPPVGYYPYGPQWAAIEYDPFKVLAQ